MAKTVIEQMKSLFTPEEWKAVQQKIDANPTLVAQDAKSAEIYSIYMGVDEPAAPAPAAAPAAAPAPAAAAPAPAAAAPAAAPAATPAPNDSAFAALTQKLDSINTNITAQIAKIREEFVPVSKLDEYRSTMLASSIKAADDYAGVRETHKAEFGVPLDRTVFEKFVNDQKAAGTNYKNMKEAHDAFVREDRIKLEVQKKVDEQVKQKTSAATVPGQTQSVAMSPALQVIKKAKDAAKGTDGKSNAMAAAQRLADIERNRVEAGAGTVN